MNIAQDFLPRWQRRAHRQINAGLTGIETEDCMKRPDLIIGIIGIATIIWSTAAITLALV